MYQLPFTGQDANKTRFYNGKPEYSGHAPQYLLQFVTFNPISAMIYPGPYVVEILEKTIACSGTVLPVDGFGMILDFPT